MNLNTLSYNEIEHKSGNLPVALYKNSMLADTKASYYAQTITRGICSDEDIANDIIVSGLNDGLTKEQILRLLNVTRNARLARLLDGYAVDDGIKRSLLHVKGGFDSESDTFSRERHSVDISSYTTHAAKQVLAEIKPVIRLGNARHPVITAVRDVKSKSADTLTKGGYLEIRGKNIRIYGDDQEVGLYFVNEQDSSKTVRLSADDLGINKPTCLACVVPAELEAGTYRIQVATQFMSGKAFRKEVLFAVSDRLSLA